MEVAPEYKIEWARELRRRQTESEAVLWRLIRGGKLNGLKFRRQHPIDRFIAEFCCESCKMVIEIDSGYHDTEQQHEFDTERAAYFTGRGYRILRFPNDALLTDFRKVLRAISHAAEEQNQLRQDQLQREAEAVKVSGTPLPARSGTRGRGEGGEG